MSLVCRAVSSCPAAVADTREREAREAMQSVTWTAATIFVAPSRDIGDAVAEVVLKVRDLLLRHAPGRRRHCRRRRGTCHVHSVMPAIRISLADAEQKLVSLCDAAVDGTYKAEFMDPDFGPSTFPGPVT